jgi:hypothetical protein
MTIRRMRRSGQITVALPPAQALRLFTPEGEREWVDGWAPRYAEAVADDTAPGTVFTTEIHGTVTIWVVADRRADGYRYVRVVPGHNADTVSVTCHPSAGTVVEVSYDLSFSEHGAAFLSKMADGFADLLAEWASRIARLTPPSAR